MGQRDPARVKDKLNERQHERQLERSDHQLKNQAHQRNLSESAQLEQQKQEYFDKLMENGMNDAGIQLLDNMLDPSWALGYITNQNYKELRWWMQAKYLDIKGLFPPEGSTIQGPLRAYIYDDPDEALTPLTGQQKVIIAQAIKGITVWVSRSREGWQQQELDKQISVSEIHDADTQAEEDGLVSGLLG